MSTTISLVSNFVQEHFLVSSNVTSLEDLSKSLGYLSSYKLHNIYILFRKCVKNDITLTLDFVYILVTNYAFNQSFTNFFTCLRSKSHHFNGLLSTVELFTILDYLNLTYDESVSLISGVDTPETANT